MKDEKTISVQLVDGVCGKSLYINEHRVHGEKPWGGGKIVFYAEVSIKELQRALEKYFDLNKLGEKLVAS